MIIIKAALRNFSVGSLSPACFYGDVTALPGMFHSVTLNSSSLCLKNPSVVQVESTAKEEFNLSTGQKFIYRIFRAINRGLKPLTASKNDCTPQSRYTNPLGCPSTTSVNYKATNTHGADSDRTEKHTRRHTHHSTPTRNGTEERTEKATNATCRF
ncbi:hypothetical protein NL108_017475 [Boleophthalmus pectinirostris]|nr:hypothetical protein NL108_017475 [Boleophthalmus pectinirostris]